MTDVLDAFDIRMISLSDPEPNGVPREEEGVFAPFLDALKEIHEKLKRGERVYLGITGGERKGSIAYIKELNGDYDNDEPGLRYYTDYYGRNRKTIVRTDYNCSIGCILAWDGRRNKIRWLTCRDTVYLPDYEGPTVWKKLDKKAAAKTALDENPVVDRDGNVLTVGDRVIYINARYGAGACLDRGTIKEIKANVDVGYKDQLFTTAHVIIENDNGEKSDIKQPQLSVLRLQN